MKVVINNCFGGFGLSHEAIMRYLELAGKKVWLGEREKFGDLLGPEYWLVPPEERLPDATDRWHEMSMDERIAYNKQTDCHTFYHRDIKRNDPLLVQVVEEMGERANSRHSKLEIVEIPDEVQWEISEYDGIEHVAEKHRTWP